MKTAHFLHVPFTGLGLYNGFRGNRWLKNRIKIFKQFVVPSLLAQTNQDFILWVGWRYEEKNNKQVLELKNYLDKTGIRNVFTYSGVAIWDDKYTPAEARSRYIDTIHSSLGSLINVMGEAETILMTIQPSDDCYQNTMVELVQKVLGGTNLEAIGYKKGYVMNYQTLELREWNPDTNPPFYTIKFDRETFIEPLKHYKYAAHESHEYVPKKFKYGNIEGRGFVVGTHGENISTTFNHPFTGKRIIGALKNFGLQGIEPLKIDTSIRKHLFKRVPFRVQKKLRYLAGEKQWIGRPIVTWIYDVIRS